MDTPTGTSGKAAAALLSGLLSIVCGLLALPSGSDLFLLEIGDQEMFGFVVRALDYGGMIFEDDKPDTLAEALAALEKRPKKWFEEQFKEEGIDLDS